MQAPGSGTIPYEGISGPTKLLERSPHAQAFTRDNLFYQPAWADSFFPPMLKHENLSTIHMHLNTNMNLNM